MRPSHAFACFAAAAGLVGIACGSFSSDDTHDPTPTPEGGAGSDATMNGDAPPNGEGGALDGGVDACPPNVDLTTDNRNCGSCGHDCLGGACQGGSCKAVQIAISLVEVSAVTATDSRIYWISASDKNVYSCPLAGCAVQPNAFASVGNPTVAIAPLGSDVALATTADIERVSALGAVSPFTTSGYGGFVAMDTDGKDNVYAIASSPTPTLLRVDAASGASATPILTKGSLNSVSSAGGHIFYYASSGPELFGVCTAPNCTDAGALAQATSEGPTQVQLAGAKDGLFWNRPGTGPIEACLLPSCVSPTKLVTTLGDIGSVAADDTYFYYAAPAAGKVFRCLHGGCGATPTELADAKIPHALTVSGRALYWATPLDGMKPPSIWRIAR